MGVLAFVVFFFPPFCDNMLSKEQEMVVVIHLFSIKFILLSPINTTFTHTTIYTHTDINTPSSILSSNLCPLFLAKRKWENLLYQLRNSTRWEVAVQCFHITENIKKKKRHTKKKLIWGLEREKEKKKGLAIFLSGFYIIKVGEWFLLINTSICFHISVYESISFFQDFNSFTTQKELHIIKQSDHLPTTPY